MEIQLQNLTKKFPNRNRKHPGDVIAVNEFNFTIPDGQLIGLLGPSGCGKSTTLNLICGLEKPTSGKIFFGGEDVTGASNHAFGLYVSGKSEVMSAWYFRITRYTRI